MGIEKKWSEDGQQVTISKSDLEALEQNFNNGYGKGQEAGKKEVIKLLSFMDIDESNYETSIKSLAKKFTDLKEGKLPKEITDKIKGSEDVIKDLEKKLEEKTNAFTALETNHVNFKRSQLIDSKLIELGARKETTAIDPKETAELFKLHYSIDIGDGEKLILKNREGNAMFTESGDPISIEQAYNNYAATKKHLFKAPDNNGSGGGGADGAGSKVIKKAEFDSKTPQERAKLMADGAVLQE